MKQFEISVNNRPGEIAKVTDIMATNGINIMAIASERCEKPIIRIVTDDDQSTRSALTKAKMKFREHDLTVLELTDRPGELSKMAKRLANAGINVESIHILGKGAKTTSIALVTDNHEKTSEILH